MMTKPENMHAKDWNFIERSLWRYPFLASAKANLNPTSVAGFHVSVRLYTGVRLWCFESLAERDSFVEKYQRTYEARRYG